MLLLYCMILPILQLSKIFFVSGDCMTLHYTPLPKSKIIKINENENKKEK